MTTASGNKDQYDEMATEYKGYAELPMARLEAELIRKALGDCTGLTVLDLGGGSGAHARQAIAAGASRVDVVDISDAMMQIGRDIEAESSESRIRWLLADASKPVAEQGVDVPAGQYDVAMANWVFDHAHNPDDLRGMWANIVASLKPGGRFVGIRLHVAGGSTEPIGDPSKYGYSLTELQEIPGGLGCVATLLTTPPFSFGLTVMEDSFTLANKIPKELGMTNFEVFPYSDAEVIKEDPGFWKDYLESPTFLVLTANKA